MPEKQPPVEPKEVAISPLQETTQIIAQYTKKLTDNKKAQEFAARVSLMARQNPKIANATRESLLTAMMACVQLDLMPNTPEQLAYVIPYGNTVQFQIGYKGLVELAYRSGTILSINAELVFPSDTFEVRLGTDRTLVHIPDFTIDRSIDQNANGVYATAKLANGETVFVTLSRAEINKVQTSAKAGKGPWTDWWGEMAKKTAVKRLTKLLPSSAEDNRLRQAVEYDSLADAGKLTSEEGEIVEIDKNAPSTETMALVAAAKNPADLEAIVASLDVQERKNAVGAIQEKIKEVTK